MCNNERRILDTFEKDVIPYLSDLDKEKLLAFGEGLSFAVRPQRDETMERERGRRWKE